MAKKERKSLSAYSIILILLVVLAILTWLLPHLPGSVTPEMIENDSSLVTGVNRATIADIFMSPFNGFKDAIDVCVFVLFLGGFLGIVTKTKALDAGIAALVRKLKGNEIILIPILMTLFSIGGSTYGMAEETIAFYTLICSTMVAAGFDSMVGAAVILLGAGVGCLGSTINPFATGIAMATVVDGGLHVENAYILIIGVILWITSLIAAVIYVMRYAEEVKRDKGSIFLSLREQEAMNEHFGHVDFNEVEFTGKQRVTLIIFAITFVIMIISLVAWGKYNIHVFEGWSAFLTGVPLGEWYFGELSMWFTFMGLIIAAINGFSEKETVDAFLAGSADILSVVLIIALSRGVSVLMKATYLDKYILNTASNLLKGLPAIVFAPASYILYMILSFLIPSTSGLATVSLPIMAPLTQNIGFRPEVMIMIFSGACGLINLITPTSGVVMGGLSTAKIEFSTYIKWVMKLLGIIFVLNVVILTVAMYVVK